MAEETTQFRLVLSRCNARNGALGLGLLYAVDAGRWSQPLWSFRLHMTDPLPRMEPGSIVDLDRPPRSGDRVLLRLGGESFRISYPLRTGVPEIGARMFAQHGDEIRHPALGGPVQFSGSDGTAVREQLRFQIRGGVLMAIAGCALLAAAWAIGSSEARTRLVFAGSMVAGTGAVVVAATMWQRARLRRARQSMDAPGLPMVMRLRWVVGTGFGAVALAELRKPGAHPRHGVERVLGVVNVPDALVELEPRDLDCVVHGDLARGIVAIDVEGATLLPAPGPYGSIPPP